MSIKDILKDEESLKDIAKVAFESVDTDNSGTIDEKELTVVMKQLSGDLGVDPPSPEDVKEVFHHLDKDNSGKIDFEEFVVLIKDVLKGMAED